MEGGRPDWLRALSVVVITAADPAYSRTHEDVAAAALLSGCRAVQLRDKEMPDRTFAELARRIKGMCIRAGALFFVNDRVDVAAAVGAGVHLGVSDLRVRDARRILPHPAVIGYSPESLDEAREAVYEGADYLGVGAVFPSLSKEDAGEPIGLEGLRGYVEAGMAPVVGVGGIDIGNAASVIEAGAAGVASVSAVAGAHDMEASARKLVEAVDAALGESGE